MNIKVIHRDAGMEDMVATTLHPYPQHSFDAFI